MPATYSDNYPHRMYISFPFDNNRPRQIPVPPEAIVGRIQGIHRRYNVISLGEVLSAGGRRLENIQWESHFPNEYDDSIEVVSQNEHYSPGDWRNWFMRALDEEMTVRVTIGGTPIDYLFAIDEFSWSHQPGPAGDIWYRVEFSEARDGTIKEYNGLSFVNPNLRGSVFNDIPKTYTVKNNQTLQDVAAIVFGNAIFWQNIYNANSRVLINARPDKDLIQRRLLSGSQVGPVWNAADPLPAGMVLTIPRDVG